ncbi:MAG TPA: DUF190 domain-containing protein [Nevskiaceae bacterium]
MKFARVYITEAEHDHGKNLYHEIFALLHQAHLVRGTTVFRGIAGFGSDGKVHHARDLLTLAADLPVVLEFFGDAAQVDDAVTAIAPHLLPGHIVTWTAQCL